MKFTRDRLAQLEKDSMKTKVTLSRGEDYFVQKTDEAKLLFNIIAPSGLVLITETGYLLLVKSFKDELSWNVQRRLVNTYFKAREVAKISQKPKVSIIPAPKPVTFYRKNRYKIAAICSSYGVEEKFLFELIFPYIEEEFDLEEAEIRYIMGTGKRLESKLDLFDFFPDMAERAKTVIDGLYELKVEHREEKKEDGIKEV